MLYGVVVGSLLLCLVADVVGACCVWLLHAVVLVVVRCFVCVVCCLLVCVALCCLMLLSLV